MRAFEKILIATDFSDASAAAARLGIELAARLDAAVTLLYIHDEPMVPSLEGALTVAPELIAASLERDQAELSKQRHELERIRGCAIGARLVESTPVAEAIVRVAAAERSDLVVMGTHGRSGVRHLLIGSVAEAVVRHCSCPVLTVRHGVAAG